MRNFAHVLIMWGLCDDRELLEWRWNYAYLQHKDPRSKRCESILQDVNAINQTLQDRGYKIIGSPND